MRRQSKKTAALYRKHGPERRDFIAEKGCCAICGTTQDLCVHEIANGMNRLRAFGERWAWLCLCSYCNCNVVTDKSKWPTEVQLALKLVCDPSYFSLEAFNAIIAPRIVHAEDVLNALKDYHAYKQ